MGITSIYGDLKVHVDDFMCVKGIWKQYRFPKSRKKRIRKKWAKKKENYKYKTVHKAIKIGYEVFVSSEIFEKIKKKLQEN